MTMNSIKKIGTLGLTLLITGSIDSIRNLPATALFGTSLIFFFVFAAVFFLIPSALVSAELAANVSEGGVYHWARRAFGEKIGFLAIWLQWINVVVWFPSMLSFIAGTAAYLVDPELAQNHLFLITSIIVIFWSVTLINLRGMHMSSRFASICTILGLIIPMSLIIIMLAIWVLGDHPLQIHFTARNMLPNFSSIDNWFSLIAIMLGFAGMELACVHIKDVNQPSKTFPRALAYSSLMILITMILGSLAIALVLPMEKINLVNGTIQTFTYFLSAYHLTWLVPVLTCMLVIGSMGGLVNWVTSPIKGLAQAAEHGFLPAWFAKTNRYNVPHNILIFQALLVTAICFTFLLFGNTNGSYWLLTALSTVIYMVMYALMFIVALKLRFKLKFKDSVFMIPGGKIGTVIACILGLIGSLTAIVVGFIPPGNIDIGNSFHYEMIFCGGLAVTLLPVFWCYRFRNKNKKIPQPSEIATEHNI